LGAETLPGQGVDLVRVDADRLPCDAVRFEGLAREGQNAEALVCYQGDLAPGLFVADAPEFEHWLDGERRRLRELAFRVATGVCEEREAAGDVSGAIRALRRASELAPEDEGTVRRLMRLHDRAGDRAQALLAYEALAARLRSELEVEPSPDTRALAHELRRPGTLPAQSGPVAAVWPAPEPAVRPAPGAVARPRRRIQVAALLLLAVVALATGGRQLLRGGIRPTDAGGGLVAIAPFRLAGADPSLAYLREGMVDLLAAKLGGEDLPRAMDPRAVLSAWRSAAGRDDADLTPEDALLLTGRLGARRLVLGGVVGRANRLAISASLRVVPGGRELARASVEGPADSLPELVDRLAAQLLALDAGEGEQRLAGLTAAPLTALRPYLAAQAAYRGGRYDQAVQEYQRALQADSNFTLAALGLAAAGVWVPTGEQARRDALARAWAGRDRLKPADRAYLVALAGPRYPAEPSARERLSAWEAVAALAPDRPDVWYEYGDVLFHKGALLGVGGARELARAAFARAVGLDSSYAAATLHLFEVLTADGDTAAARLLGTRLLRSDSAGEHADFLRWRMAVSLADSAELGRLRAGFARMSFGSLWRIVGTAQLEGVALDDAELAAAELRRRLSTRDERVTSIGYLADLALNRGRPHEAALLEAELPPDDAGRPLLDALYADGDRTAAVAGARTLGLAAGRPLARDSVQRAFQLMDRCALAQWRLWEGDSSGTGRISADLHAVNDANAPWWAVGHLRVCAALLDALDSYRRGRPDIGARLAELDSVLLLGLEVGIREPGNLASARLHALSGDTAGALAALRRREYHHRTGIPYLAARLALEARLAAALGEREAALAAARHYLALRAAPAAERQAAADTVRTLLGRLTPR